MRKNVTYLFGAGASYASYPIQAELAEKMIQLSKAYFGNESMDYSHQNFKQSFASYQSMSSQHNLTDHGKELAYHIGRFGTKALTTTIDTYAKSLFRPNVYNEELEMLRFAISAFFTTWHLVDDRDLKTRTVNGESERYLSIDPRYIYLHRDMLRFEGSTPILPNNLNVITWNYDLQFEEGFFNYTQSPIDFDSHNGVLRYSASNFTMNELNIVHLNGYHGHYLTSTREVKYVESIRNELGASNKDIVSVINAIGEFWKSHSHKEIRFSDNIAFAWETDREMSRVKLERAKKILTNTNELVIVGYSFQPPNRDVDGELLRCIGNDDSITQITVQNPDAVLKPDSYTRTLRKLMGNQRVPIQIEEDLSRFYLPFDL